MLNKKYIPFIVAGAFGLFCMLYAIYVPIPTEEKCGKVLSHTEKYNKTNKKTELYLNVDFGTKYFSDIKVELKDYVSVKDGAEFCTDIPIAHSIWHIIFKGIGTILNVVVVIAVFLGLLFIISD